MFARRAGETLVDWRVLWSRRDAISFFWLRIDVIHSFLETASVAFCSYAGASFNGSANPYSSKEWASEIDKEWARCVATPCQFSADRRDSADSGTQL
jgi:hypothetical protein